MRPSKTKDFFFGSQVFLKTRDPWKKKSEPMDSSPQSFYFSTPTSTTNEVSCQKKKKFPWKESGFHKIFEEVIGEVEKKKSPMDTTKEFKTRIREEFRRHPQFVNTPKSNRPTPQQFHSKLQNFFQRLGEKNNCPSYITTTQPVGNAIPFEESNVFNNYDAPISTTKNHEVVETTWRECVSDDYELYFELVDNDQPHQVIAKISIKIVPSLLIAYRTLRETVLKLKKAKIEVEQQEMEEWDLIERSHDPEELLNWKRFMSKIWKHQKHQVEIPEELIPGLKKAFLQCISDE